MSDYAWAANLVAALTAVELSDHFFIYFETDNIFNVLFFVRFFI